MSYLHYLCLFVYCVVFFVLFFLRLVYPTCMLPVSLDCPFVIAPSAFSNVYSGHDVKVSWSMPFCNKSLI